MIEVAVVNTHPRRRVRVGEVRRLVRSVLKAEGVRAAAVSVAFVHDARSAKLNRTYLGHAGATDVLSFPLPERGRLEGEVVVNLDRARRQASEFGVTYGNEIARLVVHGVLHLAGYDDRRPASARRMHRRQEVLVGRFTRRGRRVTR